MTEEEKRKQRQIEFFDAVGRAVILWAEVELELFDLLKRVTGLGDRQAAILFERVNTLTPRLDMLREMLEANEHIEPPAKERIDEVLRALEKQVWVRNRLVHHPASWEGQKATLLFLGEGDDQRLELIDQDPGSLASEQSPSSRLRGRSNKTDRLGSHEVREHHEMVIRLRDDLVDAVRGIQPPP